MALIECKTCGHQISDRAEACPSCGEPREWVHPEVASFVARAPEITTALPFTVQANKTEVFGATEARTPAWAWVVAIAVFLASFPAQQAWGTIAAAACGFCAVLLVIKTKTSESFHADLASRTWSSTDDYFWKPVRDALQL